VPGTSGVDGESTTAFVEPETELDVLEEAVTVEEEPAEEMIADACAGLIVAVLMVVDAELEDEPEDEPPLLEEPPVRAS